MKTVLLCDENEDMVDLTRMILDDFGYKMITAADGEKAVSLCLEKQPDLVFMDIRMPKMDGFTVTRKLRSKGYEQPIVILTGSDKQEDRDAAEQAGCDDYVLKTMDMGEVVTVLNRYLEEAGHGLE
jgi:CheY-like chemotaxis protein